jgi:hypothetical protein
MTNVYIEARPKGHPVGTSIMDYVVEDHADKLQETVATQKEAINWVRSHGRTPLVARVRH